jgi:transketolase
LRKEFTQAIEKLALQDEKIIFITGDLGYNAFENLQGSLKERFINVGVAEQNMISVAAGMAHKGYKVFCYSIAPFIIYRCLEQFRNDVCLHDLPVFLVGNGGGYGYGIMGSTHHALEDLACINGLQNVKSWIPAFNDDVEKILPIIIEKKHPAYLRLNNSKQSLQSHIFSPYFNKIEISSLAKATIIVLGPLINNVLSALEELNLKNMFDVYTVTTLPLILIEELKSSIQKTNNVVVIEEHVQVGGVAQQLAVSLLEQKIKINNFISLYAKGYPGGLYGDQNFHQKESGLDSENIRNILIQLL